MRPDLRFSSAVAHPAHAAVHAALHEFGNPPNRDIAERPRVFVTVSREPGAGALSFSHRLAERLNQQTDAGWTAWDQELVEKVSSEYKVNRQIIELLTERRHGWLDDMLQGMSQTAAAQHSDELWVYKRVAMTIRLLANAGRAIIVGRGGLFVTSGMPGGIHIRLVAPLPQRIKHFGEYFHLSPRQAAHRVQELDEARADFLKRYWPGKTIMAESFTLTLNSGQMSLDEMVDTVAPLVLSRERGTPAYSAVPSAGALEPVGTG
jgi:hypothetical protein